MGTGQSGHGFISALNGCQCLQSLMSGLKMGRLVDANLPNICPSSAGNRDPVGSCDCDGVG